MTRILRSASVVFALGLPPILTGSGHAAAQGPTAPPRFTVELEAGPAWQSYNDVEIPNDGSATRFSLRDVAGSGPWLANRMYVGWNINDRHGLRLLAATLTLGEFGTIDQTVLFAGEVYDPGTVFAEYTFNSYRLTYRYRFHAGERATAWVGVSAKVRDARIALSQPYGPSWSLNRSGEKTDLGFVPLLHFAGDWRLDPRWSLGLDADALAGGPGRAEDVALRLAYRLSDRWTLRAGYRMIEGGADVPEVYTFAWFHQAVVSVTWNTRRPVPIRSR